MMGGNQVFTTLTEYMENREIQKYHTGESRRNMLKDDLAMSLDLADDLAGESKMKPRAINPSEAMIWPWRTESWIKQENVVLSSVIIQAL